MQKARVILLGIIVLQVHWTNAIVFAQTPTFDPTREDGFTGAVRLYTKLPDGTVVRRLTVPQDPYFPLLISRVITITNSERRASGLALLDQNSVTSLSQISQDELVRAIVRLANSNDETERALTSPLTGAIAIGSLLLVRDLIDSTLNQVDAIASNALWAMRAHIAATIADMEVAFRRQMDKLFEDLDIQLKKMLIAARD